MTVTRKTKIGLLTTTLLVGALSLPTLAQNAPADNGGGQAPAAGAGGGGGGNGGGGGGGNNQGGGGGGGRNFDPAAMRQRMMDRIKTELGATDEEFAALQPKIEKVMTLSRDANAGMGGMYRRGGGGGGPGGRNGGGGGFGGGGPGGPGGDQTSDVQTKLRDLQTALQNKDDSADDIKAKLQAFRDAKTAAKASLVTAQEDLKSVLTQRQEAVLVTMGMLD
jgi:hypothetical protein